MRDPKRVDRILEKIKKIWKRYPDLRLFQLLGNCLPTNGDHYYVDDDIIEKLLGEKYGN